MAGPWATGRVVAAGRSFEQDDEERTDVLLVTGLEGAPVESEPSEQPLATR